MTQVHMQSGLLGDDENQNVLINTKTKYTLGNIIDELVQVYLKAHEEGKDINLIEQQYSKICYKLVESETFITIKVYCHEINSEPHFILRFEDISIQRLY